MGRGLQIRLACAGALLAVGLFAAVAGARVGVVHVNAGEMQIVFGQSDQGLAMGLAARDCIAHCSFDVDWRPQTFNTGMIAAGALARSALTTGAVATDMGR